MAGQINSQDLETGNYWRVERFAQFEWTASLEDFRNHLNSLVEREDALIFPIIKVKVVEEYTEPVDTTFVLYCNPTWKEPGNPFADIIFHLGAQNQPNEVEIISHLPLSFEKYNWAKHFLRYVVDHLRTKEDRKKTIDHPRPMEDRKKAEDQIRKQQDGTSGKIRQLHEIRQEYIDQKKSIIAKTKACQMAGIDPKTVRIHASDLWLNWDNESYNSEGKKE